MGHTSPIMSNTNDFDEVFHNNSLIDNALTNSSNIYFIREDFSQGDIEGRWDESSGTRTVYNDTGMNWTAGGSNGAGFTCGSFSGSVYSETLDLEDFGSTKFDITIGTYGTFAEPSESYPGNGFKE